ncbi:MAG: ABC transporter permease subunit, partial [Halobacteria archaeon]|nr:ABC transporter permease subunit [Halobacteria archaeon]
NINAGLYAIFLLGSIGLGLAFLSVSVLISTLANEKTHALGASLIAWVWFVLVHDLVALGVVSSLDLPNSFLSVLVLANPVDVFRVIVLQGVETTGTGFSAIFADTGLSMPVLSIVLIAWCVVPTLIAGRMVKRKSV